MEAPATTPPHCLVCGQAAFSPHFDVLLRCAGCGFVTARRDQPIDPRRLYEGDYFTGEEYLDYRADEAFFQRNFRPRLEEIQRRIPSGRLLEIGAAYGFFLDLARPYFDVIGYEVNAQAVAHARDVLQLNVRSEDFLAASDPPAHSVDVTVMWDVIEHLERPDLFLEKIARLSRPGGLLYVTTGDIGSRLARWRGRRWRMIHPPTHLHYFDRATITRLLDRCGFDVLDIRSIGVARSLRQILYSVLVIRLGMGGLYRAASSVVPAAAGFTLNTGDIMQVTAGRRHPSGS